MEHPFARPRATRPTLRATVALTTLTIALAAPRAPAQPPPSNPPARDGGTASQSRRGPLLILGLRSPDGDDEAAVNMTVALRHAARAAGFETPDDSPTIEQLMAMHSCEDNITPACLRQIAEELGNRRMLYGVVRRTGTDRAAPIRFEVSFYDPAVGTPRTGTPVDVARAISIDSDLLLTPARRVLTALLPVPPPPPPAPPAR